MAAKMSEGNPLASTCEGRMLERVRIEKPLPLECLAWSARNE